MSSIIKGITDEQSVTKKEPEVQVPGYGTMPLDMLKRHVQSLSKDFNDSIQKGEFLKAAYRTEQFYNALMALAKALKQQNKVDETHSTGTTVGSAGIGGGVGLGIDKSPIEKVLEKPLGEGEVVSMQAKKTPLVLIGRPFDWDIYDLRTNKVVANLLGGDRHDSPLYEIRINRNGIDKDALMKPTYVATGDVNGDGPHGIYELEVPSKVDKIEKSPGPGGTTKLRPDTMDVLGHMAKQTGQGKYYGYDLVYVSDDDAYTWIEKVLGAKIMDVDDAMEAGYTDVDPEDPAGIIYTGDELDESLPSSPGGMGQSYRKFKPKSAGTNEEQAPMFTPEEKMVNANDPMSDGWRVYKAKPAGSKDDIDEVSNFLALKQKDNEFRKIFGTTPLYKEGDKIVTKFSDKTPNIKGVVIDFDPKTKKTLIKAEDGNKYFVHAQNLSKVNKESSIMKGIQVENESSKGK